MAYSDFDLKTALQKFALTHVEDVDLLVVAVGDMGGRGGHGRS